MKLLCPFSLNLTSVYNPIDNVRLEMRYYLVDIYDYYGL
jgi:hypothetical protein